MEVENLRVVIEYVSGRIAPKGDGWYYFLEEKIVPEAHITHDIVGPFKTTGEAVKSLYERSKPL